MNKLSNTITSVARANYRPFQGFDLDAITTKVQKYLDVSENEVAEALMLLGQRSA